MLFIRTNTQSANFQGNPLYLPPKFADCVFVLINSVLFKLLLFESYWNLLKGNIYCHAWESDCIPFPVLPCLSQIYVFNTCFKGAGLIPAGFVQHISLRRWSAPDVFCPAHFLKELACSQQVLSKRKKTEWKPVTDFGLKFLPVCFLLLLFSCFFLPRLSLESNV